jgi:hypothetical protein
MLTLDATIEIPGPAMLLEEGAERAEEVAHGNGSVVDTRSRMLASSS